MLTTCLPAQPFQSKTCNLPSKKFALWAGGVAEEACAQLGATPCAVLCSAREIGLIGTYLLFHPLYLSNKT